MSIRVVPRATLERICVSPRVNSAEPWTRGEMSTSVSIGRISSWARPSGRFLSIAVALRLAALALAGGDGLVVVTVVGRVVGDDGGLDLVDGLIALELALGRDRVDQSLAVRSADLVEEILVELRRLVVDLRLAGLLAQLLDRGGDLFDFAVGDVEGVEDLGLGDALGAGLDHQDRLVGAGDDQVQVQFFVRLLGRVDDEVTVQFSDADRADVLGDRDRRDRQRRGGTVHRQDVVRVDEVHRHRHRDQLGLVVPALGEERTDRPIDHARGQRRLLARFALAAEERTRDLARGGHARLDVEGERKEVHVTKPTDGRGVEDHRVATADHDRAPRLLREFPRLEGNRAVADIHRDTGHVKPAHTYVLPPAARMAAIAFLQNSRSYSLGRVQPRGYAPKFG